MHRRGETRGGTYPTLCTYVTLASPARISPVVKYLKGRNTLNDTQQVFIKTGSYGPNESAWILMTLPTLTPSLTLVYRHNKIQ